jgi:hypothetical protein
VGNEDLEGTDMPRNDLSLKRNRLVQLGIVLEIIGIVLTSMILLLAGVFAIIIGLARHVSKRMSDSDTWWTIKLGPTARPN